LQHHLALYRDLWEQKPPGIYLTYLLGFLLFGNRVSSIFWIDYIAGALTVLAVFDLSRRLVSLRFGALAAAVVAVGTLPAARYAYGGFRERAITEPFITLLAAAAAWATVMAITRTRDRWSMAAGLFIGLAFIFKQTALIYWPALGLWTWFATDTATARRFLLYSLPGLVVAPSLAFVWLWTQGVLGDAWVALVEYNMAYLALGSQGLAGTVTGFVHQIWRRAKSDEVWTLGTVSALVALCAWRWRSTKPGRVASLGVIWLGAALIAIVANGPRLFTTYFVPPLVPLCLLFAWLLHQTLASGRRWRMAAGFLILGFTGAMLGWSGSLNRAITATAWDAHHLLRHSDRQEYLQRFHSRAQTFSAADNERLAQYIRAHTAPRDRIFVFGMTAGTYFSSERFPASRFLWAYPPVSNMIDRPEFRVETLAGELASRAPRYIVLQRHNGDTFTGWRAEEAFAAPPLAALINNSYVQETEIGDFVLYRRNDR
jgi:hypothetical protein